MFFKLPPFASALVLWSVASLLWMADFHIFSIFSAIVVIGTLFFQSRLKLSLKQLGVVTAIALGICFFCTRVITNEEAGRFLGIGTISLALLAAWLLALSLLLSKNGYLKRAPLSLTCALLIACSMSTALKSVAVITLVGLVLLTFSLRESAGLTRSWRLLLPLFVTLSLMIALATGLSWSESRLSVIMSFLSLNPPSGIRFPPTASLNSLQKWGGSDIVVLRGYGQDPPLYLVGRSFSNYETKGFWIWKTDKEELSPDDQVLMDTSNGKQAISVFQKKIKDLDLKSYFTVEFPKAGRGFTIYAPRSLGAVAANLDRIHRYGDGRLEVLAKDYYDGEYFLFPYPDGWNHTDPNELLDDKTRENCLALPDDLPPIVRELSSTIVGDLTDPEKKADFITAYLQQNFTYGYDYPFESSHTALEEFLTKRPPVHCEFFATAGALMLRAQGVPSRYINGFVVQEKSLTGGYYVVRLKHAHAWVEAFIPGKGWVTYDPTPPGTLEDPESKSNLGAAFLEWVSNVWRKFTNFFSLSPSEMLGHLKASLAQLTAFDYLKIAVLGILWGIWRRYRRPKKKKSKIQKLDTPYSADRHQILTPVLDAIVEEVKPAEWQRRGHETPYQWLKRLRNSSLDSATLTQIQQFLELYTEVRFGPEPSDSQIKRVQSGSEELISTLKGKSLEARERRSDNE